jgi:hypothetical protein
MSLPPPLFTQTSSVDWASVRRKVLHQDWAKAYTEKLKAEFQTGLDSLPELPPMEPTEWGHYYYCNDCGSRLFFSASKPLDHHCPKCCIEYVDPIKDGAWRKMLHDEYLLHLRNAAVLSNLVEDPKPFVEYLRRIILFYTTRYQDYPEHTAYMGRSKVMPQMLDEAVWIIGLSSVLRLNEGQNWFSAEEMEMIREKLFLPAKLLLQPQIKEIHNIHAWMASAVAACSAWVGDKETFHWSIDGEFGLRQQLHRGVNADGIWWEGSMSYHFYAFSALSQHAKTAAEAGVSIWGEEKFLSMLKAPSLLLHHNGSLPAHNDSNKAFLFQYALAYELGCSIWPDAGLDGILERIYRLEAKARPDKPFCRDNIHALLYGPEKLSPAPEPKRESRHLKATGLGILENENVRVCLKAGPQSGMHDHCDKLGVDVYAAHGWQSDDFGSSGYGASITQKWYQQPAAHNLPIINQEKQGIANATITEFSPQHVLAKVDFGQVEGAYAHATMTRRLELCSNGWLDTVEIKTPNEADLDWVFHGYGLIQSDLPLTPLEKTNITFGTKSGYDWLRNVLVCTVSKEWQLEWKYGSQLVRLYFEADLNTQIFVAAGDTNPAGADLGVVVVRRRASQTSFKARFEIA